MIKINSNPMNYFLLFFTTCILFSCSHSKENDGNALHTATDSLATDSGISAVSFDEKEFKKLNLPFVIDTTFIQTIDTNKRISYQQVRQLGEKILELDYGSPEYNINGFCKIDSLKQEEKYQQYIDSLDIGMLKTAIAFKVGYIDLGNNRKLFIWGTCLSSFEACPFFSGTHLIGTFKNSKNENTHFLLAQLAGSGDPPAFLNQEITARIENETVKIHSLDTRDDMDVPGYETTEFDVALKFEGDKVVIVDTKKKANNTEPETP